ncbi:ABC transporter ATP-binding protein [Cellulomonas sp. DKR-3]|uniref:ABC transporter ATP-binding protein n=1 Tax=Cellulomonas fulva TaxID=2835530 RepID=A0ABS5TX14_9CELL|nr:ABC transporter ATP-binding protein [Cellulomonas fulva]MBT0993692.1 ABC transporter ATP-binding protein [Cellulomonas fulva]
MTAAASALRLRRATRTYRGGAGLHGVDLDVLPGEVHAIVGLNGAGKSTLMKLATGMLRAHKGTVEVLGCAVASARPSVWARVGALVEHPLVYGELTGRANLELAAVLRGAADVAGTVDAVLEELDLDRYADVRARRLSLGNRQRLGLASALQHHPALVVLDEPTNALDPGGVIALREALRRRAAAGAAVLVSSHHLDEVARLASRITVLAEGRAVGALDPAGVDLERAFFAMVHAATRDAA